MHQDNVGSHVEQMIGELIIKVDVESVDFDVVIVEDLIEGQDHSD